MFALADAYDDYIGRYGASLSRAHVEAAGVAPDQRALDVGCGTGALTKALAERVGGTGVAAVDPSPAFVEACRARVPGADVRVGAAEALPFEREFDIVMSQLVVNFMSDAEAGISAMRAAARPDGVVTSCVWDYADGMTMLRAYWDAALELDPAAPDEGRTMSYCSREALTELWRACGLSEVETRELEAEASYASFEELWAPYPRGVGPGGAYCASLDADHQEELRERFRERLDPPAGPFTLAARAWFVRGRA